MAICFVLECITKFFDMLMALELSHYMGIGSEMSTYMYLRVFDAENLSQTIKPSFMGITNPKIIQDLQLESRGI